MNLVIGDDVALQTLIKVSYNNNTCTQGNFSALNHPKEHGLSQSFKHSDTDSGKLCGQKT